jgi:hypothetical protein
MPSIKELKKIIDYSQVPPNSSWSAENWNKAKNSALKYLADLEKQGKRSFNGDILKAVKTHPHLGADKERGGGILQMAGLISFRMANNDLVTNLNNGLRDKISAIVRMTLEQFPENTILTDEKGSQTIKQNGKWLKIHSDGNNSPKTNEETAQFMMNNYKFSLGDGGTHYTAETELDNHNRPSTTKLPKLGYKMPTQSQLNRGMRR